MVLALPAASSTKGLACTLKQPRVPHRKAVKGLPSSTNMAFERFSKCTSKWPLTNGCSLAGMLSSGSSEWSTSNEVVRTNWLPRSLSETSWASRPGQDRVSERGLSTASAGEAERLPAEVDLLMLLISSASADFAAPAVSGTSSPASPPGAAAQQLNGAPAQATNQSSNPAESRPAIPAGALVEGMAWPGRGGRRWAERGRQAQRSCSPGRGVLLPVA
mmetsp:Transcript_119883/g.344402  ORF Transcript_119883/g.344402 Transcript_119883/m.344402 type:complete len:218 (+) Transcript_119883:767-1420(+)